MAAPKKSYAFFVLRRTLSGIVALLILALTAFLVWRVFLSARLPASMRRVLPNEALTATARAGDLHPYDQEQTTVTRGEDNYGYFGVPRFVFLPEADQVQVVLRYNNATLEHAAEDFDLPETPPRGVEVFDVTLLRIDDLTPEDESDNIDGSETLGETRLSPSAVRVDTTLLYTYLLYTFDGVGVGENTLTVFLDIYWGDAPDYTATPYGTLRLYHHESENRPVRLDARERRALEDAA